MKKTTILQKWRLMDTSNAKAYVAKFRSLTFWEIVTLVFRAAGKRLLGMRRRMSAHRKGWEDLNVSGCGFETDYREYFVPNNVLDSLEVFVRGLRRKECNFFGLGWFSYRKNVQSAGDEWITSVVPKSHVSKSRQLLQISELSFNLEGKAGRPASVTPGEWHLDFKNGIPYTSQCWHRDYRFRFGLGADIKVPWEIGRMQHLLPAAIHACGTGGTKEYIHDFVGEVVDFLVQNPRGFGVQWVCPMDIGIRAANWALIFSILKGRLRDRPVGAPAFEKLIVSALVGHVSFVIDNLEWSEGDSQGNHYLADIGAITFVAALMESNEVTDGWLAFGVRELIYETERQFKGSGAHFEGSTSYHRLCAEIVFFATAAVLGVGESRIKRIISREMKIPSPKRDYVLKLECCPVPGDSYRRSPFPESHFVRMTKMLDFNRAMTRPDELIAQFGDNDSGRFFKSHPVWRDLNAKGQNCRVEDSLDHSHLISAACGIFVNQKNAAEEGIDQAIIKGLSRGIRVDLGFEPSDREGGWFRFPEVGLYSYRSKAVFVVIRCGPLCQRTDASHAHNDQLSIELSIDGEAFVVDPGSATYTPDLHERNRYRSTAMHNCLVVDGLEQNPIDRSLPFFMEERTQAKLIEAKEGCFEGEHYGFGAPCARRLTIGDRGIRGADSFEGPGGRYVAFHFDPGISVEQRGGSELTLTKNAVTARLTAGTEATISIEEYEYSPGYGQKETAFRACLEADTKVVEWQIQQLVE
ncbi:heparinase II/III family protein [Verrucomicrobia bacterium]|nr:heparinase II/III family protein [Verrucomicrobiota bacterium]